MTVKINPGVADRSQAYARYNFGDLKNYDYRENLITYSEQFDNAAWTKVALASIGVNAAISPIGDVTADKIIPDGTSAQHYIWQYTVPGNNIPYTFTVYMKSGGYNNLVISTSPFNVCFNTSSAPGFYTTGSGGTASMEDLGNGWFRCRYTITLASASNLLLSPSPNYSTTIFNTAGDGTSGIFLWGAQVERGIAPNLYVATTTPAITRSTTVPNRITPGTYDAALTGTYLNVVSPGATALRFTSNTDYVTVSSIPDSYWQNSWTVNAWCQIITSNGGYNDNTFFGHGNTSPTVSNSLHCGERATQIYFGMYGSDIASATRMALQTWYNITWAYHGPSFKKYIYVNGVLDTSGISLAYTGTGNNTKFGTYAYDNVRFLNGYMSDIQMYNTVLTDIQINEIFTTSRSKYGV